MKVICQWQYSVDGIEIIGRLTERALHSAPVLLGIDAVLELFGGLLVLTRFKVKLGSWFLLLSSMTATSVFHPFWFMQGISMI